ncbi:MAG: GIY-YIG nuclease family protein [Planctomycetota bacterium]
MQDKIYEYLKSQKTGATSNELVEQVLKIKGSPPVVSEKLIQTAIAGDRRFSLDEHNLWKVIERGITPLSESEFVFLSILTMERVDKLRIIIEISAQKLIDDKITERFHTFVNPGSSVIPSIQLPADIAQEIKECGVSVEKAVRSLLNFIGDAVLVGYDISSSINQLNVVLNRSSENIETPSLCLKYLVKKLIPDLHPKSLNDVAAFFKLSTIDTRRTENEVFTISEIFSRCKELLEEQGFCTLEEVLEFQYPDIEYVDFSKYAFDRSFLYAIPRKPGIYKMKAKNGDVIYVGKAKNLRVRVSSYFWNTADRLQKIKDLLNSLYTVEYELAGSELAAMLLEYRLIKQYQPRLNQQLEVRERATRYGNLKNFIAILPSSLEKSLELFFVKDGLPLQRYEILKNAVNFSEVERILDKMYCEFAGANGRSPLRAKVLLDANIQDDNTLTDIETGEMDIVLSWVDTNKDRVTYINTDAICRKEECLRLLKDYIRDEETTQKKHFRVFR